MLIVYADNGGERRDGQNCFVWEGLPPLHMVAKQLGNGSVTAMRIQVSRPDLPPGRINTYLLGSSAQGSYDGEVVTVYAGCAYTGDESRLAHVADTYDMLKKFFMDIVHGHVQGETAVRPPNHPQPATS